MRQPVTLHYVPRQQDYSAVLRLFFWQRTSTKISLAILVIAVGLVLNSIISNGAQPTIFELIWLLIPPLFLVFVFLIQPARIAQKAGKNEQLITEATWEVGELGVQITTRFGSNHFEWDSLARLVSTRDYYFLFSKNNKNAFRFLPRRAFTSQEEQSAFLALVREHLPVG